MRHILKFSCLSQDLTLWDRLFKTTSPVLAVTLPYMYSYAHTHMHMYRYMCVCTHIQEYVILCQFLSKYSQ